MKAAAKKIKNKKQLMTPTHIIMGGFLLGALIGSVLLCLPISLQPGVTIEYIDALFVSVSAMCVTGLSTVNIGQVFSGFGQVVLLILIQLGGLGVVTFTTIILVALNKKITLSERILIQNAYNLETLAGLVKLTKSVIHLTFWMELVGAIVYGFVFVPEYHLKGVWYAVFHSVSAFCNAGIDLLGGSSFVAYRDNVVINVVTMALIVLGGLGFPVYWELGRVLRVKCKKETGPQRLNFHARLVLVVTAGLILVGMLLTLLLEANNPETLGLLSWPKKCMAALFQSITLRTAGFATIEQSGFSSASCMIYLLLMFIGGSPAGTAGGVKTVTITLLLASVISNIRGKKDVVVWNRKITDTVIRRCVAIIVFSFMVLSLLTTVLLALQNLSVLDTIYEMVSAISTVGLSRGITGELNTAGKIIISLTMFLGRIGPITLGLAFNSNKTSNSISYGEGKVTLG